MRAFKLQIIILAVFGVVAVLCLIADFAGPVLSAGPTASQSSATPPAGAINTGTANNGATTTVASGNGKAVAPGAGAGATNTPGRALPPGQVVQPITSSNNIPKIQAPGINGGGNISSSSSSSNQAGLFGNNNSGNKGGGNGGAGILYNYTRNLPPQTARLFFYFQVVWIAVGVVFAYFLIRRVMVLRAAQRVWASRINQHSQTLLVSQTRVRHPISSFSC